MDQLASSAGARPSTASHRRGPVVWQRTDTVGTEIAFGVAAPLPHAQGEVITSGVPAYVTQWQARLAADWAVQHLTITCRGADWRRTLWLGRDDAGWSCRTEEAGDLDADLRAGGRAAAPLPGLDDPDRLDTHAILHLAGSPPFVSWALRRLQLTAEAGAVRASTVRVLTPSLAVLPGMATYQLLRPGRLRISGDGPATTYDLDEHGTVAYQPGRCRLVR